MTLAMKGAWNQADRFLVSAHLKAAEGTWPSAGLRSRSDWLGSTGLVLVRRRCGEGPP